MSSRTAQLALCGLMAAVATAVLALGSAVPLAVYCAPVLASLALIPVYRTCGAGPALAVYVAASVLGLVLSADREAALVFAALGYYPVLRPRLQRISARPVRVLCKLAVFEVAAGLLTLAVWLLFDPSLGSHTPVWMAVSWIVLANLVFVCYDAALVRLERLYDRRLGPLILKQMQSKR